MKRVSILLTLFSLSVGIAYAGGNTIHQNFNAMYNNGKMTVDASAKVATTDSVTYTYSGGTYSRFYTDALTSGKICLQLYGSGAQVVTTAIEALDSLTIFYYYPGDDDHQRMKVYTSDNEGSTWTIRTAVQESNGVKTFKLPSAGNYMLKIERQDNIWLEEIDYTLAPPCNCLRVVSE